MWIPDTPNLRWRTPVLYATLGPTHSFGKVALHRHIALAWMGCRSLVFGFIALFGGALGSGCTTIQIPTYTIASPDLSRGTLMHIEGLALRVDAFTDKDRVEQYFGRNLHTLGILPVYVTAKNLSDSDIFLVTNTSFSLGLSSGDATTSGSETRVEKSTQAGQALMIAGVALVSLPVAIVGAIIEGKAVSDTEAVNHNLIKQEIPSQTLSPGESVDGFVYFRLPEKSQLQPENTVVVRASITKIPSDEVVEFTFN